MWHVTFFFLVNLPKCGTVHKRLSMRAHKGTEYTIKGVKSSLVCSYRVSCLLSSLQCLFADTGKQQLYELGPKKTKWQLNKKGIGTKKREKAAHVCTRQVDFYTFCIAEKFCLWCNNQHFHHQHHHCDFFSFHHLSTLKSLSPVCSGRMAPSARFGA